MNESTSNFQFNENLLLDVKLTVDTLLNKLNKMESSIAGYNDQIEKRLDYIDDSIDMLESEIDFLEDSINQVSKTLENQNKKRG